MISFSELTEQVHLINDIILSDMVCVNEDCVEEVNTFSHHLLATKYWFSRISWANKKRYVLALLEDVRSAWALSLLLKSMWNCRPKDAVLSASEQPVWSSYDQVPVDHNRTAMPITALAQVMKNDRMWFLTLDSEAQAMVLSELLTIAGGPVMWAVMKRAQILYERYRDQQMRNLQECIVVNDQSPERIPQSSLDKVKKETPGRKTSGTLDNKQTQQQPGRAQKELEANLAAWNATIKSIRDSQKLEEVEMTFNDGTKKKIWKVNRPKPEAFETVDFLQLLPASIGKLVLSYLPRAQLGDYARVNKYWSYLVDEFRAEITARQKISMDFDRLNEVMLQHDNSLEQVEEINFSAAMPSSLGNVSNAISLKMRPPPSIKASEKSAGLFSLKHFFSERKKTTVQVQRPIRRMAELTNRLEKRGAADENLWKWCETILQYAKSSKEQLVNLHQEEGLLPLGNAHFPSLTMKHTLKVPLSTPLYKDPAMIAPVKPRKNISDSGLPPAVKEEAMKRYSLWTRDFSRLYPVFKIPSYQYPI